jgi:hypothetical protein
MRIGGGAFLLLTSEDGDALIDGMNREVQVRFCEGLRVEFPGGAPELIDGVKAVRDQAAIRYEITRVASIIRRTNLKDVPVKTAHTRARTQGATAGSPDRQASRTNGATACGICSRNRRPCAFWSSSPGASGSAGHHLNQFNVELFAQSGPARGRCCCSHLLASFSR